MKTVSEHSQERQPQQQSSFCLTLQIHRLVRLTPYQNFNQQSIHLLMNIVCFFIPHISIVVVTYKWYINKIHLTFGKLFIGPEHSKASDITPHQVKSLCWSCRGLQVLPTLANVNYPPKYSGIAQSSSIFVLRRYWLFVNVMCISKLDRTVQ